MKSFKSSILALTLLAVAALSIDAQALTRYKTDEITSEEGGPVAFPGGITTPSTTNGDLASGTASLTLVAGTNVSAVVTPVTLNYYRVGNMACAQGQVSIDPTDGGGTATDFTLTLPVARAANFSGTAGASGTAGLLGLSMGSCIAITATKTVSCRYNSAADTAVELVPVLFCHSVTGN
jgi:hypothetical protein